MAATAGSTHACVAVVLPHTVPGDNGTAVRVRFDTPIATLRFATTAARTAEDTQLGRLHTLHDDHGEYAHGGVQSWLLQARDCDSGASHVALTGATMTTRVRSVTPPPQGAEQALQCDQPDSVQLPVQGPVLHGAVSVVGPHVPPAAAGVTMVRVRVMVPPPQGVLARWGRGGGGGRNGEDTATKW